MSKVAPITIRKNDHIKINLEQDVQSSLSTGLEKYHFIHEALPDFDLEKVNTELSVFSKLLRAPILISSMTGGTKDSGIYNFRLAEAAQECGIAMGVGSQRAAIEQPELSETFKIRHAAPDILLFANLGAIQLNYGIGIDECQRAVELIEADALFLHLNPLQEALQAGGDTQWKDLDKNIEKVCRKLSVPVLIKEVGWGISINTAKKLMELGVSGIDVAGAGGTSWSQVEMHRAPDEFFRNLASAFVGWGIPTSEAILNVKNGAPGLPIFASGGLKDGLDIAKCIALGASLGGMAGQFLKAAHQSTEKTIDLIRLIQQQLRVTMFAAGAENIQSLQNISFQPK